MKKFLFFAALIAASVNANASYITLGDTVVVSPADRGNTITIEAFASFDKPFDSFDITLDYTQGLEGLAAGQLEGMYLNRINERGNDEQYIVPLHFNADLTTIICEANATTYKQVNGRWVPDGRVYWGAGDYRMFYIVLYIAPDFTAGEITLSTLMSRRNEYTEESLTKTQLVLGYKTGDVNGDGDVTISDVNALIDHILTGADFDAAADVDGDGEVSINDVTSLINVLISNY